MGGEKLAFPAILARELGSPPRGRGKAPGHPVLRISARITPAWAGKSPPHWWRSSITEDHPRVGGEKLQELTGLRNTRGSPPRGRGKACRPVGISALTRDHPRVGGEKSDPSDLRLSTPGSPPRGRGKGRYSPPTATATGITPAWAGKSRLFICFHFFFKDHPRVGGEKLFDNGTGQGAQGSPPRGRGKVRPECPDPVISGITPAWAGKRNRWNTDCNRTKDHPRVGGEKTKKIP